MVKRHRSILRLAAVITIIAGVASPSWAGGINWESSQSYYYGSNGNSLTVTQYDSPTGAAPYAGTAYEQDYLDFMTGKTDSFNPVGECSTGLSAGGSCGSNTNSYYDSYGYGLTVTQYDSPTGAAPYAGTAYEQDYLDFMTGKTDSFSPTADCSSPFSAGSLCSESASKSTYKLNNDQSKNRYPESSFVKSFKEDRISESKKTISNYQINISNYQIK